MLSSSLLPALVLLSPNARLSVSSLRLLLLLLPAHRLARHSLRLPEVHAQPRSFGEVDRHPLLRPGSCPASCSSHLKSWSVPKATAEHNLLLRLSKTSPAAQEEWGYLHYD